MYCRGTTTLYERVHVQSPYAPHAIGYSTIRVRFSHVTAFHSNLHHSVSEFAHALPHSAVSGNCATRSPGKTGKSKGPCSGFPVKVQYTSTFCAHVRPSIAKTAERELEDYEPCCSRSRARSLAISPAAI